VAGPTSLVVVSGLGGAGKSAALRGLEDLGFYCVDNLPPVLIETFADLCSHAGHFVERVAIVVDARAHGGLEEFPAVYDRLQAHSASVELLFLDAEDEVLLRRFSETRRPQTFSVDGDVLEGVRRERRLLAPIRELADRVVDTSHFTPHDLRDFIFRLYGASTGELASVRVVSFGFRSGLPKNADMVFDVRFLPNPNYVAELKPLTGMDTAVSQYVESRPETREYLRHITGLLRFLVPRLGGEGRAYLTLAVGCTGGRHRSVAVAALIADVIREMGYDVSLSHRDLPPSLETSEPAEENQ